MKEETDEETDKEFFDQIRREALERHELERSASDPARLNERLNRGAAAVEELQKRIQNTRR